jgi:hypothetical protein
VEGEENGFDRAGRCAVESWRVFSRNALLLRYLFGTLSIDSITTFAVSALARAAVRAE